MRGLLLSSLFLLSCAAERRMGSGDSLRIQASHYQSMVGVSVGVTTGEGESSATCSRDMITGSRILRWYCRLGSDPTQYDLGRPIVLELRP